MTVISSYDFTDSDADLILTSSQDAEFRVHKSILSVASPVFRNLFTLPQPSDSDLCPAVAVAETTATLDALLRLIYPIPDPKIETLSELLPVLEAALKYEAFGPITTLRALLVAPKLILTDPLRAFAIACRFGLEQEAKIASQYTLTTSILDAPLTDDLRHVTAHEYRRLIDLHRARSRAAQMLILRPRSVAPCHMCGVEQEKWWPAYEASAKAELELRPTTDVIFTIKFLADAVRRGGCSACGESVLGTYSALLVIKLHIDALPQTI